VFKDYILSLSISRFAKSLDERFPIRRRRRRNVGWRSYSKMPYSVWNIALSMNRQ